MKPENYVVGVDGGATKTLAVLGNGRGNVISLGSAGSTNYHNIGVAKTIKAIRQAVRNALGQAGLAGVKPKLGVCALAAIDSDTDLSLALRFVRRARIAEVSYVTHDSVAALHAFFGNKHGIMVNSGTGSVVAGINSSGEYARIGGWGYLYGDEGSGFDIARRAVVATFRAVDGRAPRTSLESLLKKHFRVRSIREALPRLYAGEVKVDEIAQLSKLVAKAASHDAVSKQILQDAATELADQAYAAAARLNMTGKRFSIVTTGGNFKSTLLFARFSKSIRRRCPRARVLRGSVDPVKGAYGLAVSLFRGGKCTLRNQIHPLRAPTSKRDVA